MSTFILQDEHITLIRLSISELGLDLDNTAMVMNDILFNDINAQGLPPLTRDDIANEYRERSYIAPAFAAGQSEEHLQVIRDSTQRLGIEVDSSQAGEGERVAEAQGEPSGEQGTQLGEPSNSLSGGEQGAGSPTFGLDGAKDGGDSGEDDASSSINETPMLMVHAGHFLVGWDFGQPYVNSMIPANSSSVPANSVFVQPTDAIYMRGGKVFRATFHWHAGAGISDAEQEKEIMLCRKSVCNICDPRLPAPSNSASGTAPEKPFVHDCCIEEDLTGAHTVKSFKPHAGLKNDYPRPYPPFGQQQVGVDGEMRDVYVCNRATCDFCKTVGVGKKVGKADLTTSEKRQACSTPV